METLRAHKPLIVVVNDALMDNHQQELAKAMEAGQHARATTCKRLLADLAEWATLDAPIPQTPLPEPDTGRLLDALNAAAGCELFIPKG
jgi:beta-1,4-N-acetylglucosaminyltransferase